jgi:hypothetical protein
MGMENRRIVSPRGLFSILWASLTLGLLTVGCAPVSTLARGASLPLTGFTENGVGVALSLQRAANGDVSLAATFTPLEAGYHLYSKDMPRNGIANVGRPTLLELSPNAKMQATGPVTESIASKMHVTYPNALPVYPDGPVTLTLPIRLPDGYNWLEDEIILTYMACSDSLCQAPVIGKTISIKIPGAQTITN